MVAILLFFAVCFLAYSDGANDNFKGVATLFGSGTTDYKTAIRWGTLCTFAGSVCSFFLAQSLLTSFSGKGLVGGELVCSEEFLLAVALGAGATVLLATFAGLPVSTTHGLVGALVGSGLVANSGRLNHDVLLSTFVAPLLLTPLMALCLGASIYCICRFVRIRLGMTKELRPVADDDDQSQSCQRYVGKFMGVNLQKTVDRIHFISAGIVSFARGLNDTPKIAALLLTVKALDIHWGLTAIAVAMAAGGVLNARRVAETMSHRITDMNHGQAVSANIATGLLVIVASRFGLPVSTTHVSVGALFGIGVVTRTAHYRSIAGIFLAWVVTLPCAGAIAAIIYYLLG